MDPWLSLVAVVASYPCLEKRNSWEWKAEWLGKKGV